MQNVDSERRYKDVMSLIDNAKYSEDKCYTQRLVWYVSNMDDKDLDILKSLLLHKIKQGVHLEDLFIDKIAKTIATRLNIESTDGNIFGAISNYLNKL